MTDWLPATLLGTCATVIASAVSLVALAWRGVGALVTMKIEMAQACERYDERHKHHDQRISDIHTGVTELRMTVTDHGEKIVGLQTAQAMTAMAQQVKPRPAH